LSPNPSSESVALPCLYDLEARTARVVGADLEARGAKIRQSSG